MYVDQIGVTGFRGVKEFEEPIDLSEFTILVGRNNAGKSSILEALYACFGGNDPVTNVKRTSRVQKIHDSVLTYRGSPSGELRVRMGQKTAEMVFGIDGFSEATVATGSKEKTPTTGSIQRGKIGHLLDISPQATTMLLSPSYESYTSILKRIQTMRDEVELEGAHADAAEFINKQIDDEYTEIYLETLEARKQPEDGTPFYVDLSDLGSGVLKTVAMYLAVETIEPAILVWDDMGTSLNPGLLAHVMEWLADKEMQVVASTHSIDALSTFLSVGPDDGSVVQVSKSNDDVVSHTTLDMEELALVMDNAGLDPRFLTDELEI